MFHFDAIREIKSGVLCTLSRWQLRQPERNAEDDARIILGIDSDVKIAKRVAGQITKENAHSCAVNLHGDLHRETIESDSSQGKCLLTIIIERNTQNYWEYVVFTCNIYGGIY